jgi:fructoselysine 6-kinase
MLRIAAMGDNVVDCYPSRREMYPGGNCLNVSVFARRAGAEAAYIGVVGRDRAGNVIAAALAKEGVDISHLRRLNGATAYCIIGHRDGDRVFESFDLGVSIFTPSADDLAFLRQFDAAHIGQSSGLDDFIPEIADATRLSYDFSTRRDDGHWRIIGTFCFLASLSGSDLRDGEIEEIAAELRRAGAEWILVTRGRKGAVLFGRSGQFAVAAAPVDPIDTLGAGDAFIARTLVGLLNGEAHERVLAAAADAAAETCRYFGAVGHASPLALPATFRSV